RPKAAVLEQSLPRGEARDWQARAHCEVNVARQRREIACLDRHILGQGAVAMPVREADHALSYGESRRTVAEGGDHSGQLVAGDRRCSITVAAIGPGRGPRHLSRDESRRMNLNDDVVYRRPRLGPLHQLHPGSSRSLVRHHDRLHRNCLLSHLSLWWKSTWTESPQARGFPTLFRPTRTFRLCWRSRATKDPGKPFTFCARRTRECLQRLRSTNRDGGI